MSGSGSDCADADTRVNVNAMKWLLLCLLGMNACAVGVDPADWDDAAFCGWTNDGAWVTAANNECIVFDEELAGFHGALADVSECSIDDLPRRSCTLAMPGEAIYVYARNGSEATLQAWAYDLDTDRVCPVSCE